MEERDFTFEASLLKLRYPEVESVVASVCTGSIVVSGSRRIRLPRVLFDTGALHGSYISRELVDRYRDSMESMIRKIN